MIKLIHLTNPFAPAQDQMHYRFVFSPERTLASYVAEKFAPGEPVRVSLNGGMVERLHWQEAYLRDGDVIVVAPIVQGGNLVKTLGALAVLAVATVATGALATGPLAALGSGFLGSAFASAGLGGLSAAAVAGIGAAITIGGNLLVSALTSGSGASSKAPSSSYDPDGPKTLARSGTVIPKGYGTYRWGGNIISQFTDIEGADQYINALVCYGFGPARSIKNIEINGKSINDYRNVQVYTRLGSNDQEPIVAFNRIVNGYPQNTKCLAGQPIVIPGTGTLTQVLEVDVAFPAGAYVETSLGHIIPIVITYTVRYALAGTNDWQDVVIPYDTSDVVSFNADGSPIAPHDWSLVAIDLPASSGIVYKLDNGPHNPGDRQTVTITCEHFDPNGNHYNFDKQCSGEWQPTDRLLNQQLVTSFRSGYQDFTGVSTSPQYSRTNIYGLAPAKYDVEINYYGWARLHDDVSFGDNPTPSAGTEMWVHSINEVSLEDLAYPNMILIGVRALATNQLSGGGINVTAEIEHGCRSIDYGMMPAALLDYEENNPAVVTADMELDRLYGGGQAPGITPQNITRYLDEWLNWADMNDQLVPDGNNGSIRRHAFNGVFDTEGSLWEAMNTVARMSRAAILPLGKDYGVFTDQPGDPVQIFTMGNVEVGSFSMSYMGLDERANQVEIQIADKTRDYRTDNPFVYMDPANQDAGVVIKNTRLDGKGVTDPAQAYHLSRFKERNQQFLLRTGTFKCDVDAVAVRPGSLAIFQHDVPQLGQGGRTLPGSTATVLQLDREDLPFVTGTSYNVVVRHAAIERYAGTITSVTPLIDPKTQLPLGTSVGLSSFNDAARVTRLIVNGIDSPVKNQAAGMVTIQPAAGFAGKVGDPYTLWDTDVMDVRAVTAVQQGTVTLATPLSIAPADFSIYFYGAVDSQKTIRILNVTRASEFKSKIDWVDYDPQVYLDGTPLVGSAYGSTRKDPGIVSLSGKEVFQQVSGSTIGYGALAWQLGSATAGVAIYAQITGTNGLPQLVARLVGNATTWQTEVTSGISWNYRVVGFDLDGNYASFNSAPYVTIAAVGVATNLLLGSNFTSGFTYWNITPRAGDTFLPTLEDDGEAVYTVGGSALTTPMQLCWQEVPQSKWAVGQSLMLSAYFLDSSAAGSTTASTGTLNAVLSFLDSKNATTGGVFPAVPLNGQQPTLTRTNSASVVIPAGTVRLIVQVLVSGSNLNVPVGASLTLSHLLLEIVDPSTTQPSAWADIDAAGHVLDLFTTGKSTGLRAQGSTVPSFTGGFTYTFTDTTVTIVSNTLIILWPDGAAQYVQDLQQAVTGLSPNSTFLAYPYFDVTLGGIHFAVPQTPLGSPGILSAMYDANADAACRQDGRVPLAPGGLALMTTASGATGGAGSGGGNAGGGDYGGGIGTGGGRPSGPTTPDQGPSEQ